MKHIGWSGRCRAVWRAGAFMAVLVWLCGMNPAAALGTQAMPSIYLEELTSTEVRDLVQGGATTILVPIGGTEQNGPHMVLGKHNVRARALAGQIAKTLGQTLVAPVMAYVAEGSIDPPQAHMRYAGTLTLPEPVFEAVLESTARSLRQHGFRDIVFLGDHGSYQKNEERVAARLNKEWAGKAGLQRARVLALVDYYRASSSGWAGMLAARGFSADEIGSHAGLADTALALAIDESLVRKDMLAKGGDRDGVSGDPRRATAELGRIGVARIVETSAAQIRAHLQAR